MHRLQSAVFLGKTFSSHPVVWEENSGVAELIVKTVPFPDFRCDDELSCVQLLSLGITVVKKPANGMQVAFPLPQKAPLTQNYEI